MKGKNIFKIIFIIILVVIFFAIKYVSTDTNNENNEDAEIERVVFQYPITPDMKEWSLYTRTELGEMLQIPEDILSELSTEDLVNIVLDYPYFYNVFLYNTLQQGFNVIKSDFNGLKELINRSDAGIYLLNIFKKENNISEPYKNAIIQDSDPKKDYLPNSFLAILLAQESVRNTLSDNEKNELDLIMSQNRDDMNENAERFKIFVHVYYEVLKDQ